MQEVIKNFLDKINNQSTIIVIALLFFSFWFLKGETSYATPKSTAGLTLIIVAIILSVLDFFINKIREEYKYVIEELKNVINSLKAQQRFTTRHFKDVLGTTPDKIEEKEETLQKSGYTLLKDQKGTEEG